MTSPEMGLNLLTIFSKGGSISLTERIIGAFTFRNEVYAEVEGDTTFTTVHKQEEDRNIHKVLIKQGD